MLHRPDPANALHTPDGSRIREFMGRVATGDPAFSVARIEMPAGRGQPMRRNQFHEVLIVISGTCAVQLPTGIVQMAPDDVLDLPPLTPYAEQGGPGGCVAWAICFPAFSPELVEFLA